MASVQKHFDFVSIGAYTKDTIVTRSGTRYVDGGGYSYSAHAARLADVSVGAVTRLAAEDRKSTDLLRSVGVDVIIHESPQSTLMRLEYPTDNVDERILTVASVADPFAPEHVAAVRCEAALISPSIRGEVPLEVVEALRKNARLIGLDVQGFVRIRTEQGRLAYERWPEMKQVLSLVDVLKSDAVEGEFLTGEKELHAIARTLASYGPKEIVLTHKDGLMVLANGKTYEHPFLPVELRGRSGRGDTCVGSYLSRRLNADPAEATRWATALTSLKLEAEGPVRRTRADVEALIAARYR
ncbi:sugar/nucleoside kinase (ribokinase family) [Povalibacter uvarum]|uniref:Sugar/nucleoside kinase (Ribokinase family) n=1 Tax=Povalibacter uvarum TaxID=732238 RepID=A0A841HK67_9GAMM|nr:PfkB family carbohydrate kinase [Povalibacter uvarum]MBB6093601.1 sugar/nucleoside kinase (ribokinase family) [Povalibacter uvarum]